MSKHFARHQQLLAEGSLKPGGGASAYWSIWKVRCYHHLRIPQKSKDTSKVPNKFVFFCEKFILSLVSCFFTYLL